MDNTEGLSSHEVLIINSRQDCDQSKLECTSNDALLRRKRKYCDNSLESTANSPYYECNGCKSKYSKKLALIRHIRICSEHSSDLKMSIECDKCKLKFTRKDTLQRHKRKFCKNPSDSIAKTLFECDVCKSKYTTKFALGRHIRNRICSKNSSTPSTKTLFECDTCKSKFTTKYALTRHLRARCNKSKLLLFKECMLRCLKCDDRFISKSQLKDHYEETHGISLKPINMEFQSFEQFLKWMRDTERENTFRFTTRNTKKFRSHTLKLYQCHRSGMYVDACANKRRKRFLKNCGSKKIQGWCPAELSVKIQSSSGVCIVQYQETHIGHNVKDEKEMCHVYLNKEEKLELAKRIAEGVSIPQLKKQIYLSDIVAQEGSRIGTVNLKDLHNIASSYGIQRGHPLPFSNDEFDLNIETFMAEHGEAILYYKRQDEADTKYNMLAEDDLVILFMDKDQVSAIKSFNGKLVCFDGTRDINSYQCVLHTMLIMDDDGEAKPVAFLISNRNDKTVVDIFLKNVREKVGIVKTKSLMADMQDMYYDSWTDVMDSEVEYHLYCTWHVRDSWRRRYSKINDKERRKNVAFELNQLAIEEDATIFEERLLKFLQILENDPHAESFLRYFKDNYLHQTHRWAHCYRPDPSVFTDTQLEVFCRKLEKSIRSKKKVKTVSDCLHYVLEYLSVDKHEDRVKQIRMQSVNKLQCLRNRHHKTLDYLEKNNSVAMHAIDEKTFVVQSFEESADNIINMYTVTKNESKECNEADSVCPLLCNLCGICYHEYRCSCEDSSVKNNMCEHIHVVGIFSQHSQSEESGNSTSNQDGNFLTIYEDAETDFEEYQVDIDESIAIIDENEVDSDDSVANIDDDLKNEIFLETEYDDEAEKKKRLIGEMQTFLEKSLLLADSMEELYYIKERFLDPLSLELNGRTSSDEKEEM